MRIRYLSQEEKQRTRPLYEISFPEDSQAFIDYYYQWKIEENSVMVMEEDGPFRDSFFHVMIHLNPHILWINGKKKKVPYLAAVATHPDSRRQGKMGRLMCTVLKDVARNHYPFVFLMPADPAYYTGQGFVYFPCLKPLFWDDMVKAAELTARGIQERSWQKAGFKDIPELAEFSNETLKGRYQIFVNRSLRYYQRLIAETGAERGGILLAREGGRICKSLVYALGGQETDRAEIRELLLKEPVSREEAWQISSKALERAAVVKEPVQKLAFTPTEMMVRITSLRELVPLLRSREGRCIYVKVRDSVILSNNGCFRILLERDGGWIDPIPERLAERQLDISELTRELLADTPVYINEWV